MSYIISAGFSLRKYKTNNEDLLASLTPEKIDHTLLRNSDSRAVFKI